MLEMTDYDRWIATKLFHAEWYVATYGEVDGESPLAHFERVGAASGRDPNWLFDTRSYLARYPDVAASGLNALQNYVAAGAARGRDPGPLFSTRWYLARNPDVAAAGLNPLDHYLDWGPQQRRDPSPVFYSEWYFEQYPGTKTEGVDACTHYMREGARLGFAPCPLFNTRWYLRAYKDVARSGANPLLHYLTVGAAQGRDPGPDFSTKAYLARHPQLARSGENPLVHSLTQACLPAAPLAGSVLDRVSDAALRQAADLVAAIGPLDPGLACLPAELDTLPLAAGLSEALSSCWRGLFLSLAAVPRHVVLVGRIDGHDGWHDSDAGGDETLIVETDAAAVSVAGALAPDAAWRSLAEFEPGLDQEGRAAVCATLVAALRPERVTIHASRAGAAMMARHGAALAAHTRLVVSGGPALAGVPA